MLFGGHTLDAKSLAFLNAPVQLLHVRSAVCRCIVLLEQSRYQTMRIVGSSITSLWCREAASKKSVRDITRISCFVTTMKLPHALQIYSTVFVKKCICGCRGGSKNFRRGAQLPPSPPLPYPSPSFPSLPFPHPSPFPTLSLPSHSLSYPSPSP